MNVMPFYIFPAFLMFFIVCFLYFPLLSVRNTIRENKDKERIEFPQIFLEFIGVWFTLTFLLSKYQHVIFQVSE